MAKTPVSMAIDGYKEREVLMVTYEFNQATDVEGQMAGIPRGGKIRVRVSTSRRSGRTSSDTSRRSRSPARRLSSATLSTLTTGHNAGS